MSVTPAASLEELVRLLRSHPHVQEKLNIAEAYAPGVPVSGGVLIGDDTAAIPEPDGGHLLFAAEGMMEGFIARDPWFAGYCAVMVNLSDIAAMGGRAIAIVDVIWTQDGSPVAAQIWEGMRAASDAYGVPIVGGHTARLPAGRTPLLAASVVGRARRIISSFTARPGDVLLTAVDLRAAYRGEGSFNWNASTGAPSERLRGDLELLPEIAEAGLVTGGKDISNGGLLGTLAMLLATSGCGATVDLGALPMPADVPLGRWLLSFPSYGYLLTATPENAPEVIARFSARGLACGVIGTLEEGKALRVRKDAGTAEFAVMAPPPAPWAPPPTNP